MSPRFLFKSLYGESVDEGIVHYCNLLTLCPQVSNENLRREVTERKDLLCIAARALELVETAAAKREAELLAQVEALQQGRHYAEESVAPGEDSVALYAAAFNLPPPPKKPEVAVALAELHEYSTTR